MRIGIKVPDDLLERAKPLRNMTNISQICRDAINAWVEAYERGKARAQEDGILAVVDRLHREHIERDVDWEALGQEDARLWVQLASFQDFENLFHNLKILEREGRAPGLFATHHPTGTNTFYGRMKEYSEWFTRQYELDVEIDHHRRARTAYEAGWLSYVNAVWQMLKKRVTEDMRAREVSLQEALTRAEVPNRLGRVRQDQ